MTSVFPCYAAAETGNPDQDQDQNQYQDQVQVQNHKRLKMKMIHKSCLPAS